MTHKVAAFGLVAIGIFLTVGGIVVVLTGTEGPEWVGKMLAIVIGALVALAGGQQILSITHDDEPGG